MTVAATSEQTGTELGALEALYEEYHRQSLGLALRVLGNMGEAEEVVQEAFLAAWRAGHTYDPARGSTRTWILTLVRNRAIDVVRARQRRPVQPLDDTFDPPDSTDVPLLGRVGQHARRAARALSHPWRSIRCARLGCSCRRVPDHERLY